MTDIIACRFPNCQGAASPHQLSNSERFVASLANLTWPGGTHLPGREEDEADDEPASAARVDRLGLDALWTRYHKADRTLKSRILDEFTAATGYTRKYAICLLSKAPAATRSAKSTTPSVPVPPAADLAASAATVRTCRRRSDVQKALVVLWRASKPSMLQAPGALPARTGRGVGAPPRPSKMASERTGAGTKHARQTAHSQPGHL